MFRGKRDTTTPKLSIDVGAHGDRSNHDTLIKDRTKEISKSPVVSSSNINFGRTTRLFNDMMTTLQRDKDNSPYRKTIKQTNTIDEVSRLNTQVSTKTNNPHTTLTYNLINDKNKSNKELWSSKILSKETPKLKHLEIKRIDNKEQTKKTLVPTITSTKDNIKDRYKRFDNIKQQTGIFKRTATDDRIKYDKGDFYRFLENNK